MSMGIEYIQGDLFASPADAIVIPVNCVGVAGRGLALQCKQRSLDWFYSYRHVCKTGLLVVGRPVLYASGVFGGRFIMNFPTKDHWWGPSRMYDIQLGLRVIDDLCQFNEVASIAFPKLGC